LFTTETALETLQKYDIDEQILLDWESRLGLVVPTDDYGRKQYSPHHINLFKNVRKHLALGRSIEQIREIISLPPTSASRPAVDPQPIHPQENRHQSISAQSISEGTAPSHIAPPAHVTKSYASTPQRNTLSKHNPARGDAAMVELVNKLVGEKDQLHKKLLETEKLNSHLYNANTMFHRKVKELTQQVSGLKTFIGQVQDKMKEGTKDSQNLKLLDDKTRLQRQLLETEKVSTAKEHEVDALKKALELANDKLAKIEAQTTERVNLIQMQANQSIASLENRLAHVQEFGNPDLFCGDWIEQGKLVEVLYDNFGINIESERNRVFRIAEKPARTYGHAAIINTFYEYETNAMWKRTEQLIVSQINDNRLEGELVVEFILDSVPVAKAVYRTSYTRKP
jgi:DNA-binding transcriptional MerR regulator